MENKPAIRHKLSVEAKALWKGQQKTDLVVSAIGGVVVALLFGPITGLWVALGTAGTAILTFLIILFLLWCRIRFWQAPRNVIGKLIIEAENYATTIENARREIEKTSTAWWNTVPTIKFLGYYQLEGTSLSREIDQLFCTDAISEGFLKRVSDWHSGLMGARGIGDAYKEKFEAKSERTPPPTKSELTDWVESRRQVLKALSDEIEARIPKQLDSCIPDLKKLKA